MMELQSFWGIAGYYWRFIKGFAKTSAVHYASTSVRKKKFIWTGESEAKCLELNKKLTTPHVLPYLRSGTPFFVEKDVPANAIGAVLSQRKHEGEI